MTARETARVVGRWWTSVAALAVVVLALCTQQNVAAAADRRIPPVRATGAGRDSFPHARHVKVACTACHGTGTQHGRLTFEAPRGCQSCHHRAPTAATCANCHRTEAYGAARDAQITIAVPERAPRPRNVPFQHARHVSRPCTECHSTPVTLAAAPSKASCADCHTEHHAPTSSCSTCHRLDVPSKVHKPDVAHERCDACHTPSIVAELTPTRSFCSACHAAKSATHYAGRECSTCHFLATPEAYRARLTRRPS